MTLRFLLAFWLGALFLSGAAEAQLSFSLRTGNDTTKTQSMPIDSNKCASAGPRAMYVGGVVTNDGAATVTDIAVSLSGFGNGFFLAGGQPASQAIGTLLPGESAGVYWFVGYGCNDLATTIPAVSITSSALPALVPITLTARASISANAGGRVTSSVLGPGAVVGQTIYFEASYEFGGSDLGYEFFLQPTGGQDFDAACFRLVGSEILTSNIAPITRGTRDRLYFLQNQKQAGNGYSATVRYSFEYQCAGASTRARPYALQTSGNINLKYTGNFDGSDSISISFPGATNPFTITKAADRTSAPGGVRPTVTYTVTVSNPSSHASRISRFVDTLPAGATFIALAPSSDVTAANSSSLPAAGASGTLIFLGRPDQSYLIAAGGSVKLVYSVSLPGREGTYDNSAQAWFGGAATPLAAVDFTVTAPPPLTVLKSSQAYWDPVNGTSAPKMIPGAKAAYTISVINPHAFAVTADSIVITDPTPAKLDLFLGDLAAGSGPILFQGAASGLGYSFAGLASSSDDVDFSKDGGLSWTYVPMPGADGTDPNITQVRIRPKGTMAANSNFSLVLRYQIE